MLKIEDMIEDVNKLDETMLAELSDKLWQFGSLGHIKENVSMELFHLYIGINLIGIWQSEGWDSIFGEQADFIPYISVVLQELELGDIRDAFEDVISLFPEDTIFKSNSEAYYDIYNFFTSFSYKVQNEKLKAIVPEKRRELVRLIRKKISILDELTEQYWSVGAEAGGWSRVFDYIRKNI